MSKKTKDLADDFEKAAKKAGGKDEDLKRHIYSLKKALEEYGETEYSIVSDIEFICYKVIEDLKLLAESCGLTSEDAKVLDLVHKNLRMAREVGAKKESKLRKADVKELLKIVNNDKK